MAEVAKDDSITRSLARFAASLSYEDLPPEAVDSAKRLCLDFLGVAVNGATTPSAQAVVQALLRLGRAWTGGRTTASSPILGTPYRAFPEYTALANGAAAHSIELDDVNNESSLHPGVVAFSAALAASALAPVDGQRFITAVALGYDVMVRLGRALKPGEHYARGFHPTATCGAFGAAAVTSRLLGLSEEQHQWALGIAGSQAAGSLEFLADGSWTKRLHPGWAAHSGLLAALLAREGFRGPGSIIEGKSGFLRGYSGHPEPGLVLQDLGEVFHITRTSLKPHACCRYMQGPIDCVLELVRRDGLQAGDVAEVRVGVLSAGWELIAAPEEAKRHPRSVVDEQFSMPFGVAVALLQGRASLAEFTEEQAQQPAVRELMARVQCVRDPRLEARFPQQWPAWAEVRTRDGRTLRSEVTYPKGDPENPVSWDEVKAKFLDLSAPVLPRQRQQQLLNAVADLDRLADVRKLAELARAGPRSSL